MKCLILAGGFSTRMYPLTINRAKALLEYKDKPVINHIVGKIPPNIDILISINRKFETDFRIWQQRIDRQVELLIEQASSEDQKLGAVSSLNYWVENKSIADDLLVIAGDNYFEFDITQFMSEYDGDHTLVAVYDIGNRDKASQFGVLRLEGRKIIELQEKPAVPKSSLVATACYIFPQRALPLLTEYCRQGKRDNLGSFIAYLIGHAEVHAYTFSKLWLDIGSMDDLVQ